MVNFANDMLSPCFELKVVHSSINCGSPFFDLRGSNPVSIWMDDGPNRNDEIITNMSRVDPDRVLNVYITNSIKSHSGGSAIGVGMNPLRLSENPDGVYLAASVLIGDRTTFVHEVGHYLGLEHIWGYEPFLPNICADDCTANDEVEDTPACRGPSIEGLQNCAVILNNDHFGLVETRLMERDGNLDRWPYCNQDLPVDYPFRNVMNVKWNAASCFRDQITQGQLCRMKQVASQFRPFLDDFMASCDCPSFFPVVNVTDIGGCSAEFDWVMNNTDRANVTIESNGSVFSTYTYVGPNDLPLQVADLQPNTTYQLSFSFYNSTTCDASFELELTTSGFAENPCDCSVASELVFSADATFQGAYHSGKISVTNGATLTMSSDVVFGEGSSIYVGSGSTLIVDGATLSACPDQKWQGIQVYSDIWNPAGEVILKNAAIENAEIGVNATTFSSIQLWPGGPTYTINLGGGKVFASDGTVFRDCYTGVHFGPYGSTILGLQQVSTLDNCIFDDCNIGVEFDGSAGVQLEGCSFYGDFSRHDIEASASGFTAQNCEFTSTVYVETPTTSTYAPEIRDCDFVDAQLWLEHGFSLSTTVIEGNRFFCTDPSDGIYMLSENNATIRSNDFYGCDVGAYYENTGSNLFENEIAGNFFDFNYRATTAVEENDYEYLQNCFSGSAVRDIDLVYARLFPTHGDQDNSAGNCFSDFSQTNTGKAIRGSVIEQFTYHSKDAFSGVDNCKNPKAATSGEYVIANSQTETTPSCGTNNYPYTILNRYLYCNYQRGNYDDAISMIKAIEEQINEITNDDSLSPRVKRWLIARLERCIDIWTRRSAKDFIEDGSTDEAIDLLDSRPEFRYKALAYGTILSTLDYDSAETYLLNLPTTSTAETDYVMAQQIYLNYLRDVDSYSLSSEDQAALLVAGQRSNTCSYASRSVYRLLTGDQITLSRRHSEETQERSASTPATVDDNRVYPNPLNTDYLIVELDDKLDSEIHVMDVQGRIVARSSGQGSQTIDMSRSSAGLYIVRVVRDGSNVFTTKIVRL